MRSYIETRADDLRLQAAALEGTLDTVNVELSRTTAWLLRDLIGLHGLGVRVQMPMRSDMERLNKALGYRSSASNVEVAQWAKQQGRKVMHP